MIKEQQHTSARARLIQKQLRKVKERKDRHSASLDEYAILCGDFDTKTKADFHHKE